MASKIHPTGAEKAIGGFSPKLVSLTDDVLFGDVWERSALSKRDRSLATITALIALRASEQLTFHLKEGIKNGLTQEEIVELITHMAFYTGWPSAMSAVTVAKKVFEEDQQ
jgi:4-carboxymuconolactone decarboxylase